MLPEMTPAVTRALDAAGDWARRCGAALVEGTHVFLGLTDEAEGRAATGLVACGLDLEAARRALGVVAAPLAKEAETLLLLDESVGRVMPEARRLAAERSAERVVSSDALMVALLRMNDALRQRLEGHGLDYARFDSEFIEPIVPALRLEEPLLLNESRASLDGARILDANANRAREALRVVEDYCRFVLDDPLLSAELKQVRHDLTRTLIDLGVDRTASLAARDTLGDVGTAVTTERERQRHSLSQVLQANMKRLQEALRSLEEYGKLRSPELGAALEGLRYRTYTLEKALVPGMSARQRLEGARLYVLLAGAQCAAALDWTIQEAAAGGARICQLREKGWDDRRLLERARQVRQWTRQAGVLFILNDRADLACLADADGVHLGQDDLPVKEARRILGPEALIGVSAHNADQLRRAILDGASYVGVGPTFASRTKHFDALVGLAYVRQAAATTSLPAFAIGGIDAGNVDDVIAAGCRRVAVGQAICAAADPRAAAAALCRQLNSGSVDG